MRWIELSVEAHPEAVEAVSEALSQVTANGISLEEPYTLEDDGQRWRTIQGAPVIVRAYIPEDEHAPAIVRRLQEVFWHLASLGAHFVGTLATRTVDDEDWAEAWKDHFHVTRIGRRVVIKPSWREYTPDTPDAAVIELDPGMAFGTGTHPTTRLCLEALEDIIEDGDTVLDIGTGSGILAIGALKLGARSAIGIDISTVSVKVAAENAAMNGLTDRFTVLPGSISLGEDGSLLLAPIPPEPGEDPLAALTTIRALAPAQVVVANIIARVIGLLAPELIAATLPGGTLITSGIIAEREAEAREPLIAAGLQDIERRQEGDWIALIGKRAR